MIIFKILRCDEGTSHLLAWAKHQTRRRVEAGEKTFNANWLVDSLVVAVRTTEFMGDVVARISISGGVERNRLYNWPVATELRNFALFAAPTAPGAPPTPASKIITAVGGVTALSYGVSFDRGQAPPNRVGRSFEVLHGPSKLFQYFDLLAATKKWMLRQWMEKAFQQIKVDRVAGDAGEIATPPPQPDAAALRKREPTVAELEGIAYWAPALEIDYADCFMSEPVLIPAVPASLGVPAQPARFECYFLLGKFRDIPQADGSPVPPGATVMQWFRGIIVPLSTLKAVYAASSHGLYYDFSVYNATLTAAQRATIHVLVRADYQRLKPSVYFYGGLVGLIAQSSTRFAASPFNVTYPKVQETTLINEGTTFPFHQEYEIVYSLEQHTLSSTGAIQIAEVDTTPFEGTASWSSVVTPGSPSPAQIVIESAVECGLTFYSGAGLVRTGDYSYTGMSFVSGIGNTPGTITRSSALPFVAGSSQNNADEYIPEFGVVRSGTTIVSDLTARPYAYTAIRNSVGNNVGLFTPGPTSYYHTTVAAAPTDRTDTDVGTTYGLIGGADTGGDATPRQSGLPLLLSDGQTTPPLTVGGINWYREGATGLFRFKVATADALAREIDCVRYQRIFKRTEGYRRIANSDGTFTNEENYEDPDVVLARIVARTTVIINNFAPPGLYPWVAPGLVGIVL